MSDTVGIPTWASLEDVASLISAPFETRLLDAECCIAAEGGQHPSGPGSDDGGKCAGRTLGMLDAEMRHAVPPLSVSESICLSR